MSLQSERVSETPWNMQAIADHMGVELMRYNRAEEGKHGWYDRIGLPNGKGVAIDFQSGVGMVRISERVTGLRLQLCGLDKPVLTEDGIVFQSQEDDYLAELTIRRTGRIEIIVDPQNPSGTSPS